MAVRTEGTWVAEATAMGGIEAVEKERAAAAALAVAVGMVIGVATKGAEMLAAETVEKAAQGEGCLSCSSRHSRIQAGRRLRS